MTITMRLDPNPARPEKHSGKRAKG